MYTQGFGFSFFGLSVFYLFMYVFLERGKGGRKRGRNIDVRNINQLPLTRALIGDLTHSQACALIRNGTSDLLLCGTLSNQLSHIGQGMHKLS